MVWAVGSGWEVLFSALHGVLHSVVHYVSTGPMSSTSPVPREEDVRPPEDMDLVRATLESLEWEGSTQCHYVNERSFWRPLQTQNTHRSANPFASPPAFAAGLWPCFAPDLPPLSCFGTQAWPSLQRPRVTSTHETLGVFR